MTKTQKWRAAVEIYADTTDLMTAYNFMVALEAKEAPYKEARSLASFQVMLRTYAKQFGITLPDRRRKPKEDTDGETLIPDDTSRLSG